MKHFFSKKKIVSSLLVGIISFTLTFAPVSHRFETNRAEAIPVEDFLDLIYDTYTAYESYLTTIATTMQKYFANEGWLKETVWDGIAWGLANAIIKSMIKELTAWVNRGFEGSPAFVQDLEGYMLNIADKAAGNFIWGNKDLQFLCSPFKLDIKLALDIQYRQTREFQSQCTLSNVVGNMNSFFSGNFLEGGWDGWFKMTQTPTNNPYGAMLEARAGLDTRIGNMQTSKSKTLGHGNGFLSKEYCFSEGDDQRCVISTPGTIIQDQLNRQLGLPGDRIVIADELNELIGAVFSQLVSKMLSGAGGLLGLTESEYRDGEDGYFDELDRERDPSDPNAGSTVIFNEALSDETAFRDKVQIVVDMLLAARDYKDSEYGESNTCHSGELPDSLEDALDSALDDLEDANDNIERINAFIRDWSLLTATSTATSAINVLLERYGATSILQAKSNLLTQFSTFRASGVLHERRATIDIELQLIPALEDEIEEFIDEVDSACSGSSADVYRPRRGEAPVNALYQGPPFMPDPWNTIFRGRVRSPGVVKAYRIPEASAGKVMSFTQGQQPVSPPRAETEFFVSKTPGAFPKDDVLEEVKDSGEIYPNYYYSNSTDFNKMLIYFRTVPDSGLTEEGLYRRGHAYAPGQGPWYINVRWTFPTTYRDINDRERTIECLDSSISSEGCGFSHQWTEEWE